VKNSSLIRIILLIINGAGSGCVPEHLQQSAHVSGAVYDVANRKSLAGASLYFQDYPKQIVHTSTDGKFDFPPIYKWRMVSLLPWDPFGRRYLVAAAVGYESEFLSCHERGVETNQIFLMKHE
jgi:hypothetical protein